MHPNQQYPPPQMLPNQQYPANTVIIHGKFEVAKINSDNLDHGAQPQSNGLALGGGMLIGALAGYGIGSMFEPAIAAPHVDGSAVAIPVSI